MGQFFNKLNENHITFIQEQKIFFVGTAAESGTINVSPKGLESFKIIDPETVIWLNYTGSGNETAAHILRFNRMTIMFCSFDEKPLILRIYGQCEMISPKSLDWEKSIAHFPQTEGARQLFKITIDQVQTSCGFGVPLYEFKGERETLAKWIEKKGPEGIQAYQQEKNSISLDGWPTGL